MIRDFTYLQDKFNKKSQDKVVLGKVSGSLWREEVLTEGQLNITSILWEPLGMEKQF